MDNFDIDIFNNNQSSPLTESDNTGKTPKYIKIIVALASIGIVLIVLSNNVSWTPFIYLRLKLIGLKLPKGEPYMCQQNSDCVITCSYGAVNAKWNKENPPMFICSGGCAAHPMVGDGMPNARCLFGSCVAFVGDNIDSSCTGKARLGFPP